jgi:hypothetical protein
VKKYGAAQCTQPKFPSIVKVVRFKFPAQSSNLTRQAFHDVGYELSRENLVTTPVVRRASCRSLAMNTYICFYME